MPLPSVAARSVRRATVLFAGAILSGSTILTPLAARPDQPGSDSVGVIEGEAIAVNGPMRVEVVGGHVRTMLRSGSEVRVNSGTARIDLVEGGQISICGPAHLSVLKSGGSLTVALDAGTIHAHIEREREPVLTATQASVSFGFPGATPSVSSNGANSGIVWEIDASQYCTPASPGCGPAVVHAFDATKLSSELWNSSMVAADKAGFAVKFTVPTIANGKVYIGTRGNDTGSGTSTILGELDVYGLKPN